MGKSKTGVLFLIFASLLISSMAFTSAFDLGDWVKGLFSGKSSTTGLQVESGGGGGGSGGSTIVKCIWNFSSSDLGVNAGNCLINNLDNINGVTSVNDGLDGKSAGFNGINSYLTGNIDMNSNAFTLSFWFNTKDAQSVRRIIEHSWNAAPSASGVFTTHLDKGYLSTGITMHDGTQVFTSIPEIIKADTWYHYVLTYDGVYARLYLNGVLKKEENYNKPFKKANKPLFIGGVPGVTFNGSIDEVQIYDYPHSASDILSNYNDQKSRLASGVNEVKKQCTDSDGGRDYYVKGVLNGGLEDYCMNDLLSVREYYCDSSVSGGFNNEFYKCPQGCKDGACVKATSEQCTDTDNGWNFNSSGTTTGYEIGTKNVITKKDSCLGGRNTLKYFCAGPDSRYDYQYVNNVQIDCPTGYSCSEGACLSTTIIESGDAVNLATSEKKLYMNSSLNSAKVVISSPEMPNILANGVTSDLIGKSYSYTQKLIIGNFSKIEFSKSGQSQDPIPLISLGTQNPSYIGYSLFGYEFLLTKAMDITDKVNVVGNVEFNILGRKYLLIDGGDANNLFLFTGEKIEVDEGISKSFVIENSNLTHTLVLKGTTSTTAATIVVDGVQKSVNKGSSYKFGGIEMYIKDVYHATKTGSKSSIIVLVSNNGLLHISKSGFIRKGPDETSIPGTWGTINWQNGLAGFSIFYGGKSSDEDYISVGGVYTDGVFGNLKVKFASLNPPLNDPSRNSIIVDTDNSVAAKVTFTTALANKPATLYYARDSDGNADSKLTDVRLADNNGYVIHVQEGENMSLYDKILVNAGDKGRILQLTAMGSGTSSSEKTTFQDVITGESFDFTTGVTNKTTRNIDGQTYYVAVTSAGGTGRSANITWGAGAGPGNVGSQTTLFPRIKLKDGGWFTILSQTKVDTGKTYSLPGVDSLVNYENGITYLPNYDNVAVGKLNYYNLSGYLYALNFGQIMRWSGNDRLSHYPDCDFNSTRGPAILIQEKKTAHGSGNVNGEVICIPLTSEGTSNILPAISSPVFSDGTTLATLQSSTTKSQGVTTYGTLVERDTIDNNKVSISYPNNQMTADVFIEGNIPSAVQQPPQPPKSSTCENGCTFNEKCIPYGNRAKGQYCSIDNEMKEQVKADGLCENNYECTSNLCIDNKCTQPGLIERIIELLKKILGI